jgi:hypothetical protein
MTLRRNLALSALLALAGGCSDRAAAPTVTQAPGDDVGYEDDVDVVVVDGDSYVVTGEPGSECIEIGGVCVDLASEKGRYCDTPGAQADVIVVDGKVVEVVCYPPPESGVAIETVGVGTDGQTEVPQNQGGTVVTFAPETDGQPISGDVTLQAERIALIGNGVDKTVISGNLTIASNNARVRGLTVNGNVTFASNANNSSLTFAKVKGNLEVNGNNDAVLNVQVFGNVTVNGNDIRLANVLVAGSWTINNAAVCEGNYAFVDGNGDFVIDATERGAPLTCPPGQ